MQHRLPALNSACFLRKDMRYCTEVMLDDQTKSQALSTSLLNLPGVDVLGTTVYVSARDRYFKVPHVVEIAEVDYGHKVMANLNRALVVLMDAIKEKDFLDIHELSLHKASHLPPMICANDLKCELITKKFQPHLLIIHPIVKAEASRDAYFPQIKESWVFDHLIDAISYRRGGQRATLIFYIINDGVDRVRPTPETHDDYSKILAEAVRCGVEILTAKLEITTQSELRVSFDKLFFPS